MLEVVAWVALAVVVVWVITRPSWDKVERRPTLSAPDDRVITNLDAERQRRARPLTDSTTRSTNTTEGT